MKKILLTLIMISTLMSAAFAQQGIKGDEVSKLKEFVTEYFHNYDESFSKEEYRQELDDIFSDNNFLDPMAIKGQIDLFKLHIDDSKYEYKTALDFVSFKEKDGIILVEVWKNTEIYYHGSNGSKSETLIKHTIAIEKAESGYKVLNDSGFAWLKEFLEKQIKVTDTVEYNSKVADLKGRQEDKATAQAEIDEMLKEEKAYVQKMREELGITEGHVKTERYDGIDGGDGKAKRKLNSISGQNRIDTAVDISKSNFEKSDHVVIVNGYHYADPLSASVLASHFKCPVLLTSSNKLEKTVLDEISRLGSTKLTIVGGESSVSAKVEGELKLLNGVTVERIAGADRYETSKLVAEKLNGLMYSKSVVIVDGTNFPDALTACPIARANTAPILFVRPDGIPESTKGVIDKLNPENFIVVGGVGSVSEAVFSGLPGTKTRISGKDRYETAIRVANYLGVKDHAYLVSGQAFADVIAIAPVASIKSLPILLVEKDTVSDGVREAIKGMREVTVVGGEGSISKEVRELLSK